ncbi:MAG: nucleotidyltransferase domain-containing protein [Methanobrevibacter sp.]|jgi:predicted nucleotidyltransferase|nr:nucleotidyltransferase domain-containing protein [Candidatus Methanovirga procula]
MNRKKLAQDFANSVKSKGKIEKIILFGSVARGEDDSNSDIDIVIVSSYEEDIFDFVYDKVYDILISFEIMISVHFMPKERLKINDSYFISNIKKDGVILA